MSFRSALARNVTSLQPEYVRRAAVGGRDTVFRFSVPVLRVRDVATTVSWYRHHLGFGAESFPAPAVNRYGSAQYTPSVVRLMAMSPAQDHAT